MKEVLVVWGVGAWPSHALGPTPPGALCSPGAPGVGVGVCNLVSLGHGSPDHAKLRLEFGKGVMGFLSLMPLSPCGALAQNGPPRTSWGAALFWE